MMKLWTVNWARALGGDDIPTDAFGGCIGVFSSHSEARNKLEQEKELFLLSLCADIEDEDDLAEIKNSLQITGSYGEEFYEIDYTAPDNTRVQWYITINEVELEDDQR
mgnify:CR=1 FL=1